MLRVVFGVVAGLIAWPIALVSSEFILSAIWSKFGTQHHAFQAALENGSPFAPETSFLLAHIVVGSLAALLSGFLTALITRENKRAPLIVGALVTCVGLLKAILSWSLVPLWYHVIFAAALFPMTMIGGRLRTAPKNTPKE